MPRGRPKITSNKITEISEIVTKDHDFVSDKTEREDVSYSQPTSSKLRDLKEFKFQKKPHIKVAFEKDSPVKEEGAQNESKGLWEPQNWKDFLINLRIMRSNEDAPVDSMGCHMAMDENAPPEVMRYQSLIALMLSSQTKDQVTFAAMERLRAKGLTVDNVLGMSDEELGQLIYPVGFWKTKVKYIKKTTQTLKEQYKGDIPDSVEKLCKLTGVGPKMAHICMKVAWNKVTGIGVDTHVHRISNRIGWVRKLTTTPEDTRKALQTWLPFELWSEVNHLMVGFGQTICLPISPICNECLNRDICPSSGKGRKSPKKSPAKQEIKMEEDDFDHKKDLNLIVPEQIKSKGRKSPKKSPTKQEIKTEKDFDQTDNLNLIKPEQTKSLGKKVTPKKEILGTDKLSSDFVEINKKSKATSKKKATKDLLNVNIEDNNVFKEPICIHKSPQVKKEANIHTAIEHDKKSPVKRKSSRNKDVPQNTTNKPKIKKSKVSQK